MNPEERTEITEAVAAGIRKAFLDIGINTSDPKSIQQWQRNMAFVDALRQSSDNTGRYIKRGGITLILGALGYVVLLGIQQWLQAPLK